MSKSKSKKKAKTRQYLYLIDGAGHIGRATNESEAHYRAKQASLGYSAGADARITVRKCEVIEEKVWFAGELQDDK